MTTVTMRVVSTGARATTTRRVKRARRGRATTSSMVATNHRRVERASVVARARVRGAMTKRAMRTRSVARADGKGR